MSILLKADTSIINVLFGKWKFVINASQLLNSYGGYINIFVSSTVLVNIPYLVMFDSSVLSDVVPTHIIFLFSFLALFSSSETFSVISYF